MAKKLIETAPLATSPPHADPHAVRPRGRPWLRAGGWFLALGLVGLNGWWAWREIRPVADLPVISGWVDQKRYDEAESSLRERLRRSPHDGAALTLLGRMQAARGDSLACARTLHQVPFWWPSKEATLFLEGQASKSVDRMADAEAAWKGLAAFDPLHPMDENLVSKAVLELLELYAVEERWEEARQLIWRAYDRADLADRPTLLTMRMRTELERITPATSVIKLRRYVASDPEDWEARRALAVAEHATGHDPEASRLLVECVKSRPDDPRGWRDYLNILHESGDADSLARVLAQVPSAAADHPDVLKYRAIAKETQGDWAAAAEAYRLLNEKQATNGESLFRWASAEERAGRRDSAKRHREESRRIRAARDDLNQAFTSYMEASLANPSDPKAMAAAVGRLVKICDTLGWTREAEAWARLAPAN